MKVIEQVIEFARGFVKKGYDLDYQPETESGLVQVYIDLKRKGKVIVSGPFETLQTIMKVLENN
jgi:hypothetical protein